MIQAFTFDDIQIVPKNGNVSSRSECKLDSWLSPSVPLKVPIVSSPMDTVTEHEMANQLWSLGAFGFIHRFMSIDEQVVQAQMTRLHQGKRVGGFAVGIKEGFDRMSALYVVGVRVFLIDVANGYTKEALDFLDKAVEKFNDCAIVYGSVATKEGAYEAAIRGAYAVRVGIGNGSNCTTRIKTGCGVPQASAIYDIAQHHPHIYIIADGGIRTPGDVAKALALGASSVMVGSLFAGTREAPGEIIRQGGTWPAENLYKRYYGAASSEAKSKRGDKKNVEGVSRLVPYVGKVERILNDICDGLRSSFSYVGAGTLGEFQEKAEFIRVTPAGMVEASPHGLLS